MSENVVGRARYQRIPGRLRSAVLVATTLASFSPAAATPEGLELTWSAPPGCPNQTEMIAAIEQLIGARGGKLRQPLSARGTVVEDAGRFQLELSWSTASAQAVRSVEGATCPELSQAAALIIALAADPTAEQSTVDGAPVNANAANRDTIAEPAPLEPSPPEVPPRAPAHDERKPNREPDEPFAVNGHAAIAVEFGTLPRPSVGGLVGAEFSLAPVALSVNALSFLPVEEEIAAGAGRFWLSALWLRPCGLFPSGRLRVVPCAVVEAAVIQSSGRELDEHEERWAWFVQFGLTLEARYVLTPNTSVLAGGGLFAGPSRPTFVIEGVPVHEPSVVSGRIILGFELRP